MRYGSVCSGIEAATVAWHQLGWKAAWYSEIEKFPSAVLAHHHPTTPNLGDMTRLHDHPGRTPIDLLVGGTPCQSFSIAGLRGGMADARGNLALVFIQLLRRARARWVLWENVPGVLSSADGKDLGSFFGGLVGRELVVPEEGWGGAGVIEPSTPDDYGIAWRVLDAQYFGVPQRRQRIFVVGHLGDWRPAAAVLFESIGLSRDSAPRRQAGQGASRDVGRSLKASSGPKGAEDHETLVAHTLTRRYDSSPDGSGRGTPIVPIAFGSKDHGADAGEIAPTLRAGGHDGSHANAGVPPAVVYSIMPQNSGKDYKAREVDVAQPLMAGGPVGGNQGGDYVLDPKPSVFDMRGNGDGENTPTLTGHHAGAVSDFSPMVFQQNSRSEVREVGGDGQIAGAVTGEPGAQCQNYLKTASAVRRLTPRECERLQGFPDDYTLVPWRGGMAPDGPRYKACGNSMAVPVMRWLGERIQAVEDVINNTRRKQ